jgi:hypothetical protein
MTYETKSPTEQHLIFDGGYLYIGTEDIFLNEEQRNGLARALVAGRPLITGDFRPQIDGEGTLRLFVDRVAVAVIDKAGVSRILNAMFDSYDTDELGLTLQDDGTLVMQHGDKAVHRLDATEVDRLRELLAPEDTSPKNAQGPTTDFSAIARAEFPNDESEDGLWEAVSSSSGINPVTVDFGVISGDVELHQDNDIILLDRGQALAVADKIRKELGGGEPVNASVPTEERSNYDPNGIDGQSHPDGSITFRQADQTIHFNPYQVGILTGVLRATSN